MSMDKRELVDEKHLYTALKYLRDLRVWGVARNIDPWAIRQALIIVLAMDTEAALERVGDPDILFRFDEAAEITAVEFIAAIPEALRGQVLRAVV